MIPKVIRSLVYLLLAVFPLGLLFRFKIYQNTYLVPQDIIVFLIFLLITVYFIKVKKDIFKDKFILFQSAFVALGFSSLLINFLFHRDINLVISSLYVLRYVSYLSLFFVGTFFGKSNAIRRAVYASGIAFLLIGFVQYFFYNDLGNLFYLGWDNHLYRLFSTFFDPNYAGVFYALFFFFLFSYVMRNEFNKSYKELVVLFFTLIAVYLTYSRTALVTLIVGFLAIGILKNKFKFVLLSSIVFVILLFVFSDVSIEGLNPFRTASSSERLISLRETVSIIEKNPILGVGFNAFRYAQVRYGIRSTVGASVSNADAGTDNSLLFVLATSGILGLVFFICSYVNLLIKLFKERTVLAFTLFCSVVGLIAGSLFLNVLFYTPIISWLFLIISLRTAID